MGLCINYPFLSFREYWYSQSESIPVTKCCLFWGQLEDNWRTIGGDRKSMVVKYAKKWAWGTAYFIIFKNKFKKNFDFSMLVCVRGTREFCPKHARTRIELKLIEFRLCLESLIYLILLGYFGKVENLQGS